MVGMPEPLESALTELASVLTDRSRLVRAVGAGRRRGEHPTFRRVGIRWVDLAAGPHLQVESFDERQSFTRNVPADDAPATVAELLAEPYANWHVEATDGTRQLRVTKKGAAQMHRTTAPETGAASLDRRHDRVKQRMLEPGDRFLHLVGIADTEGRIKPSRRAKFHQIDAFLRALAPLVDRIRRVAGDRPVRVVDLGCGNAYLTFAAYRWLTAQGLDVDLIGVDVKREARRRNSALAADLGWADHVRFVDAAIDDVELPWEPDVVLALHACDTATDDALARAVRWNAPIVLAAPCCHHDIQRQLKDVTGPDAFDPVLRHGILRERFADVLTDSLRAAILTAHGYRTEVIEFVDSVHTPRNALIRAVATKRPEPNGPDPTDPVSDNDYRRLVGMWPVKPALADRLGLR